MTRAETLRIALAGIAANKLRSGLTILGMTIGVAAVIVLVAVGNGSKQQVQARHRRAGLQRAASCRPRAAPAGRAAFASAAEAAGSTLTTAGRRRRCRTRSTRPTSRRGSPVVNADRARRWSPARRATQPSSFVGTTPAYATTRDYEHRRAARCSRAQDVKQAPPRRGPRPDRRRRTCSPARTPSASRSASTARLRGRRRDRGPRAPTASRTRTTSSSRRSPPCRTRISGYGSISTITVQGRVGERRSTPRRPR